MIDRVPNESLVVLFATKIIKAKSQYGDVADVLLALLLGIILLLVPDTLS